MNAFLRFILSALIAGVLFLAPLAVLIVILGRVITYVARVVQPVADLLPIQSLIGLPSPVILASLLVLLFCILVGLVAQTRLARRSLAWLEEGVLANVPGYEFGRSFTQMLLGVTPQHYQQVVLFRSGDHRQFAFLVERHDGGLVTIYVPSSPKPQRGAIHIVPQDRIEATDLKPLAVIKCLQRMGVGSAGLLASHAASRRTPSVPTTERPVP